jgi:hypothetical protein
MKDADEGREDACAAEGIRQRRGLKSRLESPR